MFVVYSAIEGVPNTPFEAAAAGPEDDRAPHQNNCDMHCKQMLKSRLRDDLFHQINKCDSVFLLGCKFERRQFWVLTGFMSLFAVCFLGTVVMWFTSAFDNSIFSTLAIVNNSKSFEIWQRPSPKPLIKMYIFNYTNAERYLGGEDERPHVQELGPYVYEESMERVNVHFNGSLVSYQEQRSYRFVPEASAGRRQNDRLVVPNVPLFAAGAMFKDASFLARFAASRVLSGLNARPFLTIPAHRFIVGYEDNLYAMSKNILKLNNQKPYDNFGLLVGKVGVQKDVVVLNTGAKDINKIGLIASYNGRAGLGHWSTEECNALHHATDGTMFSPKTIRERRPVQFYFKEMCRTMPLHYERPVSILNGQIPAYRYALPYDVFDNPARLPRNQCYCNLDLGECPPQGVFNATPCAFGAPTFFSFPHFYRGDPALLRGVRGLDPDHQLHKTYADIHPTFGFVMAGKTRLQLNVQVIKSYGMTQLSPFEDKAMLPVAWFEMSLEDKTLPEDMVNIIFQTTFTVKAVENCLKYGSLCGCIGTLLVILLIFKRKWQERRLISISMTNNSAC